MVLLVNKLNAQLKSGVEGLFPYLNLHCAVLMCIEISVLLEYYTEGIVIGTVYCAVSSV